MSLWVFGKLYCAFFPSIFLTCYELHDKLTHEMLMKMMTVVTTIYEHLWSFLLPVAHTWKNDPITSTQSGIQIWISKLMLRWGVRSLLGIIPHWPGLWTGVRRESRTSSSLLSVMQLNWISHTNVFHRHFLVQVIMCVKNPWMCVCLNFLPFYPLAAGGSEENSPDWLQSHSVISLVKRGSSCHIATA